MKELFNLPIDAPLPGSSFVDLLGSVGASPFGALPNGTLDKISAPEGTTVLGLRHKGGVVMAGDRQATEGYLVAHRRIQKVFQTDSHSAVAISGVAGMALEMVRLFQTELEHYEKIEGTALSLEGKANFAARLVRGHLPMAFQGLVVVPLFAGYDPSTARGRLYSYDMVGGRYEEQDFGSTGSGARLAKSYLRSAYREDLPRAEAVDMAVAALMAAAEEDTATGGPNIRRRIFPTVLAIDADGVTTITDDELVSSVERESAK